MLSITHVISNEIWNWKWWMIWFENSFGERRNVCCLNINEGGMGMINIDNYVKSKDMQSIWTKIPVRWTHGMQ